jgi:hypothetical protein
MSHPGWIVVQEIAEQLVKRAAQDVIDCPNELDVLGLQRKAQAANKFWNDLQNVMRSTTQIDDAGLAGSL